MIGVFLPEGEPQPPDPQALNTINAESNPISTSSDEALKSSKVVTDSTNMSTITTHKSKNTSATEKGVGTTSLPLQIDEESHDLRFAKAVERAKVENQAPKSGYMLNRSRSASNLSRNSTDLKNSCPEDGLSTDAKASSGSRSNRETEGHPQMRRVFQARRGKHIYSAINDSGNPNREFGENSASATICPNSDLGEMETGSEAMSFDDDDLLSEENDDVHADDEAFDLDMELQKNYDAASREAIAQNAPKLPAHVSSAGNTPFAHHKGGRGYAAFSRGGHSASYGGRGGQHGTHLATEWRKTAEGTKASEANFKSAVSSATASMTKDEGVMISTPAGKCSQDPTTLLAKPNIAWADLLKSNRNSGFPLKFYKPDDGNARNCIEMPVAVTKEGSKKWESTLMGYFIEKKLPYSLVSKAAYRYWGKVGLSEVLATESGYFFFKFSTTDQKDAVMEGGPWHFASQPMILKN